jgi:hypothetical protein
MAGSTSTTPAAATPEDPAPASCGTKRSIEDVSCSLLRSNLEDLMAKKDKNVPLTVRLTPYSIGWNTWIDCGAWYCRTSAMC